jgi:hypothetical protein
MAGNKNSGRKGWDKEIDSKELWQLSVPVLKHALKSKDTPSYKKIEIALALVNKMMPAKTETEHSGSVTMMPTIKIDGQVFKLDVGE